MKKDIAFSGQGNLETSSKWREESGKGTTWSMLFCLCAITLYLKGGNELLDAYVPLRYHTPILLTLAILTFFTLGCALHMIFLGEKSVPELRKSL